MEGIDYMSQTLAQDGETWEVKNPRLMPRSLWILIGLPCFLPFERHAFGTSGLAWFQCLRLWVKISPQ